MLAARRELTFRGMATRSYIEKIVLKGLARKMCGGIPLVEFSPGINVLAGPNGSGKSTVLRVLRDRAWATREECEIWREGEENLEFVAFDSEQDNARFKPGRGPLQFISTAGSHGQVQLRTYGFLRDRISRGSLVMLDEPEAALDMAGIVNLVETIKARSDVQWILATHHPALWQIPGARIIELRPGHVQYTIAQWRALVGGNFAL